MQNPVVIGVLVVLGAFSGWSHAPFDWDVEGIARDPIPVDAIPDTGENQQIVFSEWPGRSPQDVDDQITYPLTVALTGVPGVKSVRSNSMFGFASIAVVFEDDVEFYWSRSRLLEKLSSLPRGTLPEGVQPALGPDATPLGQVYWYTLEGRDEHDQPAGGFDLDELRSLQDWYVRNALSSVAGVAEVASIGGYVREYQIDVDPDAMRAHGVTLNQVFSAVRDSNVDTGARTIEVNRAEYVVRGLGRIEDLDDIRDIVVRAVDGVPITLRQIAQVGSGPALRRGALDKGGSQAVGGVVVARYGANPLAVIDGVKAKLASIEASLPSRELDDGRTSRVTIQPFYDRTELIEETLDTLGGALYLQVLVTIVVVLVMVGNLRAAGMIAGLLPLAVLLTFVAMKRVGVDANIVALSGIAIAIGTMVDMGIVLVENILRHVTRGETRERRFEAIHRGASEVGGAVLTAVATTVVGFLPVFAMQGAEGKLFKPLAATKTMALIASIVVALMVLPPLAAMLLRPERDASEPGSRLARLRRAGPRVVRWIAIAVTLLLLTVAWRPFGPTSMLSNLVFVSVLLGSVLFGFRLLMRAYEPALRWCLANKLLFLLLPASLVLFGAMAWLGFARVAAPVSAVATRVFGSDLAATVAFQRAAKLFPGLPAEFMPSLDEGSFLLMPVTMPHASIGEALELMQMQDLRLRAIPEVREVVGKIGRVESPLDPAPISMVETLITYWPEFRLDSRGEPARFAYSDGDFVRDAAGALIPDDDGRLFRQWRDEIQSPDDIWDAIAAAANVPGMTTASKLQPIETRRIMLQTGMRSNLGLKVFGPDLETVEQAALELESQLERVDGIRPETVFADRLIGKPYFEIDIDRERLARYGLTVAAVQDVVEVAIGGRQLTTTIEGRERYPVRVRYQRELRDSPEQLANILVAAPNGAQIPLGQLSDIRYATGPQSIKSEDTFLTAYVLFDKQSNLSEVEAVERARSFLDSQRASGRLDLPPGVSYQFAGTYENQVRAAQKLRVVLPIALLTIFLILYLQFRSVLLTAIVFSGVFVAWSGGFLLLWLYSQPWFLDLTLFGYDVRDLFQIERFNLSVAVWVGFLALFGIATDDGVVMTTYLKQRFESSPSVTRADVHKSVVEAAMRRIRPCLMTSATTILALVPVLTSRGRGADVLIPMAIPSVGGMLVVLITIFVVPVLYCAARERRLRTSSA